MNETASIGLTSNVANTFKVNLMPAIFLQVVTVCIGLSFFFLPASRPFFDFFSDLKLQHGILYAAVSTAIFGGLIPISYLIASGKVKSKVLQQIIFYCCIWAFLGVMVDILYTYQAVWFGADNAVSTIVKKTLFDQLIFSSLFSCPFLTIAYIWKDEGFSWSKAKAHINKQLVTLKIPTTIITNWIIWFPAVSVIYTMPTALQVPLFNLVLCFFVLLLSMLDRS